MKGGRRRGSVRNLVEKEIMSRLIVGHGDSNGEDVFAAFDFPFKK